MRALSHHWRVTRTDSLAAQALLERRSRSIRITARRWLCSRPTICSACIWAGRILRPQRPSPSRRRWRPLPPTARTPGRIRRSAASISPRAGSITRWPSSNWRCSSTRISRWRRATTRWRCPTAGAGQDAFAATQRAIRQSPRDPSSAIYYGVAAYAQFVGQELSGSDCAGARGDPPARRPYRRLPGADGRRRHGRPDRRRPKPRFDELRRTPAQYFPRLDRDPVALEARRRPRALSRRLPPRRTGIDAAWITVADPVFCEHRQPLRFSAADL